MTTARQIVNRAAEILGYKDRSESLDGTDAASFLDALNDLVDTWATAATPLYVYATTMFVQMVSGNGITIGPGATINTARPVRIPAGGFFRIGSTDYRFEVATREQYDAFPNKDTSSSFARFCYYEPTVPTGTLYFYPAISGSGELHLPVEQRLSSFADLDTAYTIAPGYKSALQYSLAEELAPGLRPLDPNTARLAAQKRAAIQSYEPGMLQTGLERRAGNILAGWNQ